MAGTKQLLSLCLLVLLMGINNTTTADPSPITDTTTNTTDTTTTTTDTTTTTADPSPITDTTTNTTDTTTTTTDPTTTTTDTTTTTTDPTTTTTDLTTTTDTTTSATDTTTTTTDTTTTTTDTTTTTTDPTTTTTDPTTTTTDTTTTTTDTTTTTADTTTTTTDPTTTTTDTTTTTADTTTTTTDPTTTTTDTTTTTADTTTTTTDPTTTTTDPTTTTTGTTTTTTTDTTTTSGTTTNITSTTSGTINDTTTTTTTMAPDPNITTTSSSSTAPVTTTAPGHCDSNPCPLDSTCEELMTTYKCVCRPGLFYDDERKFCFSAKTFPIDIKFEGDFIEGMNDKKSEIFKETAENITQRLNTNLIGVSGYLGSTVLSLTKGSIVADIENFFRVQSNVNASQVKANILEMPGVVDATEKSVCITKCCDEMSTTCEEKENQCICTCKIGYIKLTATPQACLPCPSGQRSVNSVKCEMCPFGYSGFNCDESYLLILVIVGSVLGGLLLITLICTIVLCVRSENTTKYSEEKTLSGTLDFTKPAAIPRIPRVNPNTSWQPTNLEMTDSGSTRALVTKDRTENTTLWDYDYPDDTRSQMPSRTGYGTAVANNATRNPYYDEDRMRRY